MREKYDLPLSHYLALLNKDAGDGETVTESSPVTVKMLVTMLRDPHGTRHIPNPEWNRN